MKERAAAPHENSYWLDGDRVAAGEYPGDLDDAKALRKVRAILDAGITVFVDLTEQDELKPYEPMLGDEARARGIQVRHLRRPIRDLRVCSPREMTAIMQTLRDAVDAGEKVYVHCWGGVGRTGTVAGCWLVEQGMTPDDALAAVARLFATISEAKLLRHPIGSPETGAQREMVRSWAPSLMTPDSSALPRGARDRSHFRGCLLGGAIGDALGAPVEFLSLLQIRSRFGPLGIRDFAEAYGRIGAVTDDTQMTMSTAEALIRAMRSGEPLEISDATRELHDAYLRWLRTQDDPHQRRAPGTTCLTALRSGHAGTVGTPINGSKGCGGVMRAAPVGLLAGIDTFTLGCESAAITHGHPSGFLAAGCLALIVERIVDGSTLDDAVAAARQRVAMEAGHEEVSGALDEAIAAARHGAPSAERVEQLGKGWVAEEALGIAVYCALSAAGDFERGVVLAVNHGGDSDSTGAITGNILGALLGSDAIPARWLEQLELRDVIERLADELCAS